MSTEGKEKETTKKPQKLESFRDDLKTQEQLEDELGVGVEKVPKLPDKPDVKVITLDLSGPKDIDTIVKEIDKLPAVKDANAATEKYDAYKKTATKIWVIKQANEDSWNIPLRVGEKKGEKYIWQRDDVGRIMTEPKRFYYNPITRQEKEEHLKLLEERESANYDLIVETEHINKIIRSLDTEEQTKFLEKKTWIRVSKTFAEKSHLYYYGLFRDYFGATEDDINRISYDDIIAYVDVALYKEGVKNPQ